MKPDNKKILKIICAVVIIAGCPGCDKTITCSDANIETVFVAFPVADIDTLVLRKFKAGDNFQHQIDTHLIVKDVSASYTTVHDTTYTSFDPYWEIMPGFDWQIFLPSSNQTIVVTGIMTEKTTGKCAVMSTQCYCPNKILDIQVDHRPAAFTTKANAGALNDYCKLFIKK